MRTILAVLTLLALIVMALEPDRIRIMANDTSERIALPTPSPAPPLYGGTSGIVQSRPPHPPYSCTSFVQIKPNTGCIIEPTYNYHESE
jgi:hypothetical protein